MKRRITTFEIRVRHLPHWEMPGATYHIVFSLRKDLPCNLTRDDIAPIILNAFAHYANQRYYLYDHTVMPDHVHAILQPIPDINEAVEQLSDITHDIKSYTAHRINGVLSRKGSVWLHESYDRIIRDEEEYQKTAKYIFENPERAGLISSGESWKWWSPGIESPV